jgi:hypothetical protein
MASSSQHSQENTGAKRGGAGQMIVELRGTCGSGLLFWSRQRFETGAELQVRMRGCLLSQELRVVVGNTKWVNVRGFVADCRSERRHDGSFGFLVSLLLASQVQNPRSYLGGMTEAPGEECFLRLGWLGPTRLGLN